MSAWADVSITGIGKWCDPDHRLNSDSTVKDIKERKERAKLTTPAAIYIHKYKDTCLEQMQAADMDPKQCKGQPMYMLKFFKATVEPTMSAELREALETEAVANRTKLAADIRAWKGLPAGKRTGGGGGARQLKPPAEGWMRAPAREVNGKSLIGFFYNPSNMQMSQMRVLNYTELAEDGLPLPPDGMLVKGSGVKHTKRKASDMAAEAVEAAPAPAPEPAAAVEEEEEEVDEVEEVASDSEEKSDSGDMMD